MRKKIKNGTFLIVAFKDSLKYAFQEKKNTVATHEVLVRGVLYLFRHLSLKPIK